MSTGWPPLTSSTGTFASFICAIAACLHVKSVDTSECSGVVLCKGEVLSAFDTRWTHALCCEATHGRLSFRAFRSSVLITLACCAKNKNGTPMCKVIAKICKTLGVRKVARQGD